MKMPFYHPVPLNEDKTLNSTEKDGQKTDLQREE